MPSSKSDIKLGLVLPAGGARAAYQVGVLRHLGEHCPGFFPKVLTGISAGSINACFLAQGEPIRKSVVQMYELWERLEFNEVFETNFGSIFAMFMRWFYDLSVSKVTKRLLLKSLLDAKPLSQTLLNHIHSWKISRAIRTGAIDALAISTTNYQDGNTTIFFDSTTPIPVWKREKRIAVRTTIRIRHIMASCSIPILFEPVRIGDSLFGDGSLRLTVPFSPAIHLGATHVIAIGIRCPHPEITSKGTVDHLSLGFLAGSVLDSIFLDSVEADYENLVRMNEVAKTTRAIRPIPTTLIRPSRDLGALAKGFISEMPFHFRQLFKATTDPNTPGDLLSYLMFSKGYIRALLELGRKDAEDRHKEICDFIESPITSTPSNLK